jgi:electron-transferring-flavoprotein dehydrogenase
MPEFLVPARHQAGLPMERLLVRAPPGPDAVAMDVVLVGGGPASLACAIELARLAQRDPGGGPLEIAVLEKAEELGQHCLSVAVVNPVAFRALFPGIPDAELPFRRPVGKERVHLLTRTRAWRVPTPPPMRNEGNHVASICEIVRWLGAKAEALGVHLFTGFPVEGLLVEGERVRGVRTVSSGLRRDGSPGPGHQPPTDLTARVVGLGEGTRGPLTQAWRAWKGVGSTSPQVYALGVKEIWETRRPLDAVVHTLGWPLRPDTFGGSFCYPLEDRLVALGLVVGLDDPRRDLDVHALLQRLKTHPFFRELLDGGECVEWGAKTIPEGGYHALPERFSGDGVVLLGDAAGLVDVPSLKGIHYAMTSGILAARALHAALQAGDTGAAALGAYDEALRESFVLRDLRRHRNVRTAFREGFVKGGAKAALMILTGGAFPAPSPPTEADAEVPRGGRAPPGGRASHAAQGGRGLPLREPDARRHPVAPPLRGAAPARDGGPPRAPLPRGRVRGDARRPRGERAELRGLQGDRRARTALDAARGGQRPPLPADVALSASAARRPARPP